MKTITKEVTTTVTENILEIKDIIKWLAIRGILSKFLTNLYSSANPSRMELRTLADAVSKSPGYFITRAFGWANTPEGHSYWWDKEKEWWGYLKENNIKGIHIE